jgi:hypothetical protein
MRRIDPSSDGAAAPPPERLAEHGIGCGRGGPVDVVAWRRCRLLEAGFPPALAARLASTRTVDLHALLLLVDRGCPPELAARILSPVRESA